MTTATTRSRARKARTVGQELMRRPADALSGDFIILSARLAETPPPVFWAEGELDARTTLAAPTDADWDDNYRRVFDDPWWDWNWYRDALLADERAAIPVYTLTDDDPELTARVNRLMAAAEFPVEPPGPAAPQGDPAVPPLPAGPPAGPGSPTSDEASDDRA